MSGGGRPELTPTSRSPAREGTSEQGQAGAESAQQPAARGRKRNTDNQTLLKKHEDMLQKTLRHTSVTREMHLQVQKEQLHPSPAPRDGPAAAGSGAQQGRTWGAPGSQQRRAQGHRARGCQQHCRELRRSHGNTTDCGTYQVKAPRDCVTKATKQRGKFRVKAQKKKWAGEGTGSTSLLEARELQNS